MATGLFSTRKRIQSASDAEFQVDYGIVEEVVPTSESVTINPIDFYRHAVTRGGQTELLWSRVGMSLDKISTSTPTPTPTHPQDDKMI
jgi:hypothetical protein